MKKLYILLLLSSFSAAHATKVIPHLKVDGLVLVNRSLDPLQFVAIQMWIADSMWYEFESDEDGYFEIMIQKPDTFDLKVELGGYHSQIHPGLILESTKVHGRFDIYMIPSKFETIDIHCNERCWCIYHENFDRVIDTLSEIRGLILDENTKQPIPFANISILKLNGEIYKRVQSDFDGYYHIDSIVTDSFRIHVSDWEHEGISLAKDWFIRGSLKWNDFLLTKRTYYNSYYDEWDEYPIDLFAEEQRVNALLIADIPNTELALSMVGYPNPFQNTLTVERLPENEEIRILDIMGNVLQTIYTQKKSTIRLDLTFLQKGLYFIHYEEDGKDKNYGIVKK